MFRAVWNGAVLAESDRTVKLEGNHYFPPESLHREYLAGSPTTSTCPWKGQARYSHITVDGKIIRDAAWYYPQPSPAAAARVRAITGGPETVPTVVAGTRAMVNPSARQVIAAMRAGQPGTLPADGPRPASWLARAGGLLRRRRPGQQNAVDEHRRPASG